MSVKTSRWEIRKINCNKAYCLRQNINIKNSKAILDAMDLTADSFAPKQEYITLGV